MQQVSPQVSIIASVKSQDQAEQVLHTLATQTNVLYEVIFVCDNTYDKAGFSFKNADMKATPSILYAADPLQAGIMAAKSDYLYVMDAHITVLHCDAFARLIAKAHETEAEIIHGNLEVRDASGETLPFDFRSQPYAPALSGSTLRNELLWLDETTGTKLYSRNLCQKIVEVKNQIDVNPLSNPFLNVLCILLADTYIGLDYVGFSLADDRYDYSKKLITAKQFFTGFQDLYKYCDALNINDTIKKLFRELILERFAINLGYACLAMQEEHQPVMQTLLQVFGPEQTSNALIWAAAYNGRRLDALSGVFHPAWGKHEA